MNSQISRDERGIYHWTGVIDRSYENKTFRIAFGVCGGICAAFILMSLFMGGEFMGTVLLSCLGVMAVCGGVCWLFNRNAGHRKQSYLMDESCGADFINTRTEEKIGEVIVFRDFEMDLMPKLVLFSDDARYMLYILQANANTIAEYTKIRWKYPEHRIDYPEKTPEPAPRPAASQPTPAPEPVPSATERRASELRAEMQALQSELAVMEKELYSLKGLFTIGKRAKLAAKMSPKVIRVKEIQEELNEIE